MFISTILRSNITSPHPSALDKKTVLRRNVSASSLWFIAVFLFFAGIFPIFAQDLIILTDGNEIEAKVLEISPSEIRYKRFDNLDGPTIILPVTGVLSIRYENGTVETFNTASAVEPVPAQAERLNTPVMDPDKLYVGIFAEPSGFAMYGPSLAVEFTKGSFNTLINFRIGALGMLKDSDFGAGVALNYFFPSRIGGFYVGGMIEYSTGKYEQWRDGYHVYDWYLSSGSGYWNDQGYWIETDPPGYIDNGYDVPAGMTEDQAHNFGIALSAGYKFVLSSGMYFRAGGYVGYTFSTNKDGGGFLFRPEVTVGYNF